MKNIINIMFLIFTALGCSNNDDTTTPHVSNRPTEEVEPPKNDELGYLPSPGTGKKWTLQPTLSSEFDYPEGKAAVAFQNDWQDKFFNGWTGPGMTRYTAAQSSISNGELVYKAKVVGNTIQTGCITSKNKGVYPLYMEVRVKISESVLASAVWMLSEDSAEEIDNLEAFGEKSNSYFSKRLHLSHHVFIRNPFQDYQPEGEATWYTDGKTQWADDYHNYGVLWTDPWTLSYYVDGKLVRTTPKAEIDPKNFTNGNGLTKPMHMIISAAAQSWRENVSGINFLTDPSVTDEARTTMRVDWIRVYKPE
ncbi:beta-agarase [Flavobacterium collinsii]|nr:beta-agarase [Flavobacterium collinsii]